MPCYCENCESIRKEKKQHATANPQALVEMWLVMKAYPWAALELGVPFAYKMAGPAKGQPERFMPVFDRRKDAIEWAGDGERILEVHSSDT